MNNNEQSKNSINSSIQTPIMPNQPIPINQKPLTQAIPNTNIQPNQTPPLNNYHVQPQIGTNDISQQPSNNTSQTIQNNEQVALKSQKTRKKGPHIFFLFLELITIGLGTFFLIQSNNKYNTYTITGADLFSQEKVYKAGKPYYKARYQYIVKDKKYYYDNPKYFEISPDQIIQLRYNPKKPAEIYNSNEMIFFIIIIAVGTVGLFITIGILISITGGNKEKIVTVIVEDIITCVGGRKIIMRNINTPIDNNNPQNTEYYSYYTAHLEKFTIGRKLKFNAHKYNEVLTTDKYKENFTALNINDFKIEDFITIN